MSDDDPRTAAPALVVVSYGSADLLAANLARMPAAADHTVVVVDNRRTAAEQERVRALATERGWVFLATDGNPGFGAGVNRGVAAAAALGHRTFVVLNPDAYAEREVIDALGAECNGTPTALVSPTILRADGRPWFVGGVVEPRTGHLRRDPTLGDGGPWGWLTGACLAFHVDLWRTVGGFDERYFLYWEDVDLSRRWIAAGGRLRLRTDLVVRHDVGGTQVGTGKSPVYMDRNCRNRLLYAAVHLDRAQRLWWLVHTPTVSARILLRVGPRVAVRSPRLVAAAVRGSAAGVVVVLRSLLTGRRPAASR